MAGVIWYTYTPGILEYLAPKRLPGLGIALVVSILKYGSPPQKFGFYPRELLVDRSI